jgi:hypothetical protein
VSSAKAVVAALGVGLTRRQGCSGSGTADPRTPVRPGFRGSGVAAATRYLPVFAPVRGRIGGSGAGSGAATRSGAAATRPG